MNKAIPLRIKRETLEGAVENRYLKLPKLKTTLRITYHRHTPCRSMIKSATIKITSSGKFIVSLLTEEDIQPKKEIQSKIGLDLGLTTNASISDETDIANPSYLAQGEDRIKRHQRALSRKVKGFNPIDRRKPSHQH